MIQELTKEPHSLHSWLTFLDAASALLGMLGTYFMSRRFAKKFFSGILFALIGTFLYLFGQGAKVRRFYANEALPGEEIKDAAADSGLGLNLLFIGFLAQLAKIAISWLYGKS
jgi:hypothetical protein